MVPFILSSYLYSLQIFHTPEGMLSSEQGVYVAETVAAKNMKQAKGRFRAYEDQDGLVFYVVSLSIHFVYLYYLKDSLDYFVLIIRTKSTLIILPKEKQLVEKQLLWEGRILGSQPKKLVYYSWDSWIVFCIIISLFCL